MSVNIKILLIEDDTRLRSNLIEILEMYHYKIHYARDGADGYAKALSIKPDLIICDLIMPEMTGFEFIDALKDSRLSYIPIILLSGKKYFNEQEMQILARVAGYLKKPFAIADLIMLIKKHTGNK